MNIYVGNLPFSTTESELRSLFDNYESVTSATLITDRESGRSRGFGFIELSDDEEATRAIDELNGFDLDGRNLTVNKARPRVERR